MKFNLARPCPRCPFRSDVSGYLHRERAREIAMAIANGSTFACHETTVEVEDETGEETRAEGPDSQMCAGALIVMEKTNAPNQITRIAGRLGQFDPDKLDMSAPVVDTFDGFIAHHGEGDPEPEEADSCAYCGPECLAPAGYLVGGSVISAEPPDPEVMTECKTCGEPMCEACVDEAGLCPDCADA